MNNKEKFDPTLINAAGYAERFPLEPFVIERDLETAQAPPGGVRLSSDIRLESLSRIGGLCCFRDHELVKNLKDLPVSSLQLIREYIDGGRAGNDLIPKE